MDKINVAVGIVFNKQEEVLITQRSELSSCPSLWEFPGGKIEDDETAAEALVRELKEEVDITCLSIKFFQVYSNRHVKLHVFTVSEFQGVAACLEEQQGLKWVDISALKQFQFPPTNTLIISDLQSLF